jgi:hypothetical protein
MVSVDTPVEIGTEMLFLPNSTELIEVLDNCELDKHRLDMLLRFEVSRGLLSCSW